MPKISVIVPVYNCEAFIERCVQSILNQTFSDFELILVDDGSADKSGKMCDEYAKKDDRVRVIHQKNAGQAAARNRGVKDSRCEWLHFVDGDDLIHPQMLEILYNLATESGVKLSMCEILQGETLPPDFFESRTAEAEVLTMNEENIYRICKNDKYHYWTVCAKLIHKSVFLKYPLPEGKIYEDNATVCKWLYESKKAVLTATPLYFYAVNPQSTTRKTFSEKQLDVLWAFEEQIEFFDALNFKKITEYLLSFYFEISANLRYRIKHESGTSSNLKHVKACEKHIKKKYRDRIHFDTRQKLYIYERTNYFMFMLTRVKRKLFEKG